MLLIPDAKVTLIEPTFRACSIPTCIENLCIEGFQGEAAMHSMLPFLYCIEPVDVKRVSDVSPRTVMACMRIMQVSFCGVILLFDSSLCKPDVPHDVLTTFKA